MLLTWSSSGVQFWEEGIGGAMDGGKKDNAFTSQGKVKAAWLKIKVQIAFLD